MNYTKLIIIIHTLVSEAFILVNIVGYEEAKTKELLNKKNEDFNIMTLPYNFDKAKLPVDMLNGRFKWQ